jgi:maltose O-acetyltransferase
LRLLGGFALDDCGKSGRSLSAAQGVIEYPLPHMPIRVVLRTHLRDVVINGLLASMLVPKPLRWRLMRLIGFDVRRSSIAPCCFFGSTRVAIGEGSHISYRCFFDGLDRVTIGRNCDIAMEVLFGTSTHRIGDARRRGGESIKAPVIVGDGVWIGARAMVMPGVTVGDGCVIGAGSIVTKDCQPNGLYVGAPARRVQDL